MDRKIITEEVKEALKTWWNNFVKYEANNVIEYRYSPDFAEYCKSIGLDSVTLTKLDPEAEGIISYKKAEETNTVNIIFTTMIQGEVKDSLSVIWIAEDFMNGFQDKEDNSLEDFFNDNIGNVVRKLRESYPDVVEAIEDELREDLDDKKEEIARDWITENPGDAIEEAKDYLDSYDLKGFIKDFIDEL